MSQAPKRSSNAVTLNSRLETWRYQGRFNTRPLGAMGLVSLTVLKTEIVKFFMSWIPSAIPKIHIKSILRTHVTTYSSVELVAFLPVTPRLGIVLLHWHSRLETWRCPAKQQLHPSSKNSFETKISHALRCSSVNAYRRITSCNNSIDITDIPFH